MVIASLPVKPEQPSQQIDPFRVDGGQLDLAAQDLALDRLDIRDRVRPDFLVLTGNALAIELVRRSYFLEVQQGRASGTVLDESKMPAKTDAVRGIEWLPRIIPKTKAKLRGELPASLMYCCGGDRRFFKAHDIHPAEFLSLVWRNEHHDSAIIDWVVRRSAAAK